MIFIDILPGFGHPGLPNGLFRLASSMIPTSKSPTKATAKEGRVLLRQPLLATEARGGSPEKGAKPRRIYDEPPVLSPQVLSFFTGFCPSASLFLCLLTSFCLSPFFFSSQVYVFFSFRHCFLRVYGFTLRVLSFLLGFCILSFSQCLPFLFLFLSFLRWF